jgi:hypothetical protein
MHVTGPALALTPASADNIAIPQVEDSFVVLPAAVNSYFSVELITYGFRHQTNIIELHSGSFPLKLRSKD